MFLVKNTCTEYSLGATKRDRNSRVAPKGYRWVVAARKKDIQWEVMRKTEAKRYARLYNKYRSYFEKGECPKDSYCHIDNDELRHYGECVYKKGDTLKDFLSKRGIFNGAKYSYNFHSMFNDEEYLEEVCFDILPQDGKVVHIPWNTRIDNLIDSLDDETVLVGVDCHI